MNDLSIDQIVKATGCPSDNVAEHWPNILNALIEQGINTESVQIAAAGTVAVETGRFEPIHEIHADPVRQPGLYAQQARYWDSGYYGRGFIQLSLQENYHHYGIKLGLFLEDSPELAMDPINAARILALYFKERRIELPAEAHDWDRVRQMVNGGTNGLDKFKAICERLV